jgi:hypothetical protein
MRKPCSIRSACSLFLHIAYLANLYISVDAPRHEWGLDLDEPSSWREQSEKEAMAYYGCTQRYAKSIKVLKVLWNNCTDVMSEVGSCWIQIPRIPQLQPVSTPAYPSPSRKVFLSDAVHAAITGLALVYIVTSFVWNSRRVFASDRFVTGSVLAKNVHCLS